MKVEFWFEFASTYSYLSAMRLPAIAKRRGIEIAWCPFLLGPIFASQGLSSSPFNIYPIKGQYMWRDVERRANGHGLGFRQPEPFPQNGLLAARVATAAPPGAAQVRFCQAVFEAEFALGCDISDRQTIETCARDAGLAPDVMDRATSDDVKQRLRQTTEYAQKRGIFGAPSFTVGDELFWGDDRLEEALDWAAAHG
ncbi:2-hydroxychromene-2-carboxylate isomerase [Marivita sp. XM-24bin2]|jgi:2-hydroxychromene-2-carboxylate isomerase|uniref:2-hydroxychromene-2-carboxylate isomerase n=1 Tax=unclassified Marivita TaxID=2632480 RepID=UPI000D791916|nr:2-hydroxychromene-2-carboxylate isomerase [Marivita sp. XM-24bin2]MCR9107623.1 2-hydroxychromene-2-carboxylate isomerase [Paracoccaceae bacterium]PWL33725.1 MAG: disulfide bond formation protein DsbA [Marivita sp. XM-24bin2]